MTLTSASIGANCGANPLHSVTCNDTLNGGTLTGFGNAQGTAAGTVVNGTNTVTTTNGGTVLLNTDGTFVYNPAVGFEGADSFWYTLTSLGGVAGTDNASVTINVGTFPAVTPTHTNGMAWFITPTPGGSPTGRQANPISLDGFRPINNGTGSNPAAGDTIFALEGAHPLTATLTLLGTQKFIGEDATVSVATLGGAAPQLGNSYLSNSGGTVSITSTAAAITLGASNTIAGFTVGNSTTAITGGAAGTLNVREVTINTNGAGLVISAATLANTGTFPGFSSITTTGGTNGISLTGVGGTLNTAISLAGATAAAVNINGGTVSATLSGGITQGNNAAMVNVSGGHSAGTLTFQSGTLSATNGTGLQFDNADGTYNSNGTTTLNGGDAGIDIVNGSGGTFAFGGTTITNPTGVAVNVDGTSAAVTGGITMSGAISKNTNGKLVDFFNYDTGTATYSGSLSCTSVCDGIEVTNNGSAGTVNFSGGTKTLNTGASTAVNLDANTGGAVNFTGGGLNIDTTSGTGFSATGGGTVTVTGSVNTIDTTTGTGVPTVPWRMGGELEG